MTLNELKNTIYTMCDDFKDYCRFMDAYTDNDISGFTKLAGDNLEVYRNEFFKSLDEDEFNMKAGKEFHNAYKVYAFALELQARKMEVNMEET